MFPDFSFVNRAIETTRFCRQKVVAVLSDRKVIKVKIIQRMNLFLLPAFSPVASMQKQSVGTDRITFPAVPEPKIQQGKIVLRNMAQQAPAASPVVCTQNYAVVTDGPSQLTIVQINAGESDLGGNSGLSPALSTIFRAEDMTAFSHSNNQSLASGHIQQERFGRQRCDKGISRRIGRACPVLLSEGHRRRREKYRADQQYQTEGGFIPFFFVCVLLEMMDSTPTRSSQCGRAEIADRQFGIEIIHRLFVIQTQGKIATGLQIIVGFHGIPESRHLVIID